MASPSTAPPAEPRAPWGLRIAVAVLVALPLVLLAAGLAHDG